VKGHYKVFVHIMDDEGRIVAQSDAVPAYGGAPTETWLPNEVVIDQHGLQMSEPGRYRVLVGMYDPVGGQRLPATGEDGRSIPDNAVPIEEVQIPMTHP
jgi:hypothetical protein